MSLINKFSPTKLPASLLLSASPGCHLPTLWKPPFWNLHHLGDGGPKLGTAVKRSEPRPGRGWSSEQTWHSCQGFELQPMDLPSSFPTVRFSSSLLHTKNSGGSLVQKKNKPRAIGTIADRFIARPLRFYQQKPLFPRFFDGPPGPSSSSLHHYRCVPRSKGRRSGSLGVLDAYTVYMVNSRYICCTFVFKPTWTRKTHKFGHKHIHT